MKEKLKLNFDQISALYKLTQQVWDENNHDATGVSYELAKKVNTKYYSIIEKNKVFEVTKYSISLKDREMYFLKIMILNHLQKLNPADYQYEHQYHYFKNFFRQTLDFLHQKLA